MSQDLTEAVDDLHLWRSSHPGAKALRRTGFYLLVFTLPAVLALTGIIPEAGGAGGVAMWLTLGWIMIGIFGPIMVLWFGAQNIGDYIGFFPVVRRSVGILLLLGAVALGLVGYMAVTDPSIQSRKAGAPFVFAGAFLLGGWRLLRGGSSKPGT